LGFFLIWFSLSKVSFSEIVVYAKQADYKWLILGVLIGFASHLSRAYRWLYTLEPLGYNVKFPNSFMAVFIGYLVNYTIPRAGEVARASTLTTYEGIPFEKAFGTIVAERVADLLLMLIIILITLGIEYDFIYNFFTERFESRRIGIGLVGLIVFSILVFYFIKKSSSKIAIKIKTFVNGLLEGISSIFKMKHKWSFIFHTIFIWVMYVLMFYTTSLAFPDLHGLSIGAVLVGFISATFSIAATNGGIGSYPAAVFAAFTLFGIAKEPSFAFGWMLWTAQTLMIILFGGLSFLYLPIYNRKFTERTE